MKCEYCESEMKMVQVRVKRPVPSGAKDLGITDETICWQCPTCQQTSQSGIKKCLCGATALYWSGSGYSRLGRRDAGVPSNVPLFLCTYGGGEYGEAEYRCTNCIQCLICKKFIGDAEYECRHADRNVNLGYYHADCIEKQRQSRAESQALWEAQRKLTEQKQALDEKKRVEQAEKLAFQQEQQRRTQSGLCLICGKSLGFFNSTIVEDYP